VLCSVFRLLLYCRYIAAHFDLVALGQASDDRLNCLLNLLRDLWRLKGFVDVTLYRNRRQAITALQDRFFGTNLDVADLTEWNSLPPAIHQSHIVQFSGIEAVCSGTSSDYLHGSNIFTDLRHRRTGQKKLDLFGGVVGRKTLEGFEKVAKRFDSTAHRDPLVAVKKILLDYIAYAEENPNEYRVLFLSVETLGGLELTREDLQERNPAFGALFRRVETCIKAGVLQGDAFAVSTLLWTAAHGAASLLITAQKFPFGNRKLYAEEVVATILSGAQYRVIARI
jgi:AcrR family transcriptional regulator